MTNPSHNDLREALHGLARQLDIATASGVLVKPEEIAAQVEEAISLLPIQSQGVPPGSGAREALGKAVKWLERYSGSEGDCGCDEAGHVCGWPEFARDFQEIKAVAKLETPGEGSAPVPTAEVGALRWTMEVPTSEGFYLCRPRDEKDKDCWEAFHVDKVAAGSILYWDPAAEEWLPLPQGREWAGPLPDPIPAPVAPSGEGRP